MFLIGIEQDFFASPLFGFPISPFPKAKWNLRPLALYHICSFLARPSVRFLSPAISEFPLLQFVSGLASFPSSPMGAA